MSITAPSAPSADHAGAADRQPDAPGPAGAAITAGTGTELFVPDLVVGTDGLGAADAAAIGRFVREVALARGFPLHLAVAWNALHFGYDLAARSYPSEVLRWFVPTIGLDGEANPAVPVGALAWVHVGGTEGDVWAEVVGKDGRPDGGGEEVVDPALAGAPAPTVSSDGFEQASVHEALVVDFEAFGPLPDGLDRRLGRLQRRGRLDHHGLIVTEALYYPPEAASDDDLWFYARWLVDHQPDLLRAGPLGAAVGPDADVDVLAAALLASIEAVSTAVSSYPGLRRWGDYVLPAEWVDEVDAEANLPLGSADLTFVLSGLARSGAEVPVAATLLGRLEPLVPAGDPSRPDHRQPDPLSGVGFVRRVVRSNRWLADHVDAAGGAVELGGRLVAVRVDDMFPFGGLWRAEPVVGGHPLLDVPADVALNLGRLGVDALADYLGVDVADVLARIAAAEAAAAARPEPEPDADGPAGDEAAAENDELDPTLLSATVTLRATDVDNGTLRLPDNWEWLAGQVTVMLSHAGDIDDDQLTQAAIRDGARLGGLSWPIDFFPGIRVHLSVFAGGSTVFTATLPLVPPVGDLRFEFDTSVAGPGGGGGGGGGQPGGAGDGDTDAGGAGGIDLTEALIGVLSRRGRLASDGSRRASARDLAVICFGAERPAGAYKVIADALDPAVDDGRLTRAGSEYSWESGRAARGRRQPRPPWWHDQPRPVRVVMAASHVPGFLRRLPPGFTASAEKRASYAQARSEGDILFGPEALPDGYTWVRPHDRSGVGAAYAGSLTGIVSAITGLSPGEAELAQMRRAWGLAGMGPDTTAEGD